MSNDQIIGGGGDPAAAPKRRTGLVVGVVAAVVAAVGLPLGGFALYNALSGGGAQPHDALPGDAIAYFRVDVDPSAGQKVEALRLLDKFPAFEEATGIDDPREDVRKAIFEALKRDSGCDLDFEDDVDPWLGERLGVAALAPADGQSEPGVAVAVQVKDEDAGREGIDALLACGDNADGSDGSDQAGWAYYNDYLIVAETQKLADGYAEDAEQDPLADNDAFTADMDRLGEQGVASVWFDGQGVLEAARSGMGSMDEMGGAGSDADLQDMTGRLQAVVEESAASGAAAVRFDSDHAEVALVVNGRSYEELEGGDPVEVDLPESTAVALGAADAGSTFARQWDQMMQMQEGEQAQAEIEKFEAKTGLALPEDLETLFGDNFVLSLDSAGLTELLQSFDVSTLGLGAQIATDPEAFAPVYEKLQALAASSGVPLPLTKVDTEEGVVVAANPDYAQQLEDGGSLTDTDKYQAAVDGADEAQSVFYVDLDVIETLVAGVAPSQDQGLMANLEPLQALGGSARFDDGYAEMTLRLTVD